MTAALWHNTGLHASPLNASDQPDIEAPGWLTIRDVVIKDELSPTFSYSYIAQVQYRNQPGLLTCRAVCPDVEQEIHVGKYIQEGDPEQFGIASTVKDSFAKLAMTADIGRRHCAIFTWSNGVSLMEYMQQLSPAERESVLPDIIVQIIEALEYLQAISFVHENINPDYIIVSPGGPDGAPKVTITGLHTVQGHYMSPEYIRRMSAAFHERFPWIEGTYGYRPPEDYSPALVVNPYKRMSWMLGATIYAALTGLPPYGFTRLPAGLAIWPEHQLSEEMLNAVVSGQNPFQLTQVTQNQSLVKLVDTLMKVSQDSRPTIGELDPALISRLFIGNEADMMDR
ncbi:kinase-like domain-containing protein [Thamnocephalis sphaerospora]|uniref:Kinase-like domain-containing protein n=1 Tax=Thamnocephalis sphaerospora TaxID=78915 RepID=A0A4P9XPJ1_9FUNG|nr:kinase-like domain-containing protein [Thamnocephalis sphaerospora]|eukprot:RKP07927.1 kinase-like domain-containing protein [Thamnocephalis sphaerospora]